MANLETLELTISANAESATQGIGQLTRSLSAFQTAVGKSVGGLLKLNEQLSKLKSFGRMKLPNLGKVSKAAAVTKGANSMNTYATKGVMLPWMKEAQDRNNAWNARLKNNPEDPNRDFWQNNPESAAQARQDAMARAARNRYMRNFELEKKRLIREGLYSEPGMGNSAQAAVQANNELAGSQQNVARSTTEANNALTANARATKDAAENAEQGKSAFQKLGERIQTIAKTMLIRTAIRALMKSFMEAWQSAYQFSKNMGGSFAKGLDSIKGSLNSIAMALVKAFTPLITIVAPILNVVAQGIEYLSMAIQELLKLLGFASELFGATSEQIANTGSNAKAAKNVLSGFDELNVLDNSSGSGGGAGNASKVTDAFSEQINAIKILIAESLLAVGLVLAFSGHIGVGLALAAVGAATIAGTVATQWGTLSDKVKGEITTIMLACGGAMLAIGAILAFTGVKTGLGIALMAVGVANMAASVALSWNLSDEIKQQIGIIMSALGGASLAIGAILALTGVNIPLGIALMAIGGVSLAGAVALNWDTLVGKVTGAFDKIKEKLSNAWDVVKKAVDAAWGAFSNWASATWDNIKAGWELIKSGLSAVWNVVSKAISDAWNQFTQWLGTTWNNLKTGWTDIKNKLSAVWAVVEVAVYNAWNQFKQWVNTTWNNLKSGWENIKTKMSDVWNGIQNAVYLAWCVFKNWLSAKWDQLSHAWELIKTGFSGVWNAISGYVSDAWERVKTWFQVKWGLFSSAWDSIKTNLSNAWGFIQSAVSNAWGAVKEWFNEGSGSVIAKIKAAWSRVKDWFEDRITKPIGNFFKEMVNKVIDGLNWVIRMLNKMGKIEWDGIDLGILGKIPGFKIKFWEIKEVDHILLDAEGDYDVPKGQLFIANEAGPELVGTMGNHTTVANQMQIIEGIRKGVYDAQAEQNALLRRQNDLLLGILEKDTTVNIGASSMLGKTVRQSLRMYETMVGV